MTLKYESEILFDLMKRDGDDAPSDVLPYESELKEKYLKQVEGAYPKLMDYRPEWLNYNLYGYLPAEFPVENLSNVTNATVDNVVPYAYGSASLKGQTLVNVLDLSEWGEQEKITLTADGTDKIIGFGRNLPIKPSTKYLTIIPVYENTINNKFTIGGWNYYNDQPVITKANGTGIIKMIKTTKDVFTGNLYHLELWKENTSGQIVIGKPMVIEYLEGMENWDISYFEGMQSVQMPGLTTTGKNLFDGELELGDINVNNGIPSQGDYVISKNFNGIKGGVNVICSVEGSIQGRIYYYDFNKNFISTALIEHLEKTPQKAKYFKIRFNNKEFLNKDIMMDYGTTITPYEPYQSIILTSPKDLELRGIGDVKDELNLLTGEVTQRIGETTLDGSEGWWMNKMEGKNTNRFRTKFDAKEANNIPTIKCGELKCIPNEQWATDDEIIEADAMYLTIRKPFDSEEEFTKWLSQNPITIQYHSKTESIKTVEITVTDQNGKTESYIRPFEGTMHIMTNGTPIKPTATIEVPVEAITQNLMSFANIEEEE